jgi:mannosyltransferase OCH1-like enzyme
VVYYDCGKDVAFAARLTKLLAFVDLDNLTKSANAFNTELMMKSLGSRVRRILYSLVDPVSCKLLLYFVLAKLTRPELDDAARYDRPAAPDLDSLTIDNHKVSRIIFQVTRSHQELTANWKYWSETFRLNNPDYSHLLWDAKQCRRFIESKYRWFLAKYDSYPRESYRLDIIRSFLLSAYGGFYAHMDSECLKPLEGMREAGDVLLGQMGYDRDFEQSITNATMASKPKQMFWLLTIAIASEQLAQMSLRDAEWPSAEKMTGPVMLKTAVDYYVSHRRQEVVDRIKAACPELAAAVESSQFGRIHIFAPPICCPINWNNFIQSALRHRIESRKEIIKSSAARRLFPHAYVVTYWDTKHNFS